MFDNGVAPYVSYSTSFEPVVGLFRVGSNGSAFQPTTGEGKEVGVKYQPFGPQRAVHGVAVRDHATERADRGPAQSAVLGADRRGARARLRVRCQASASPSDFDLVGGVTHIEPIVTASTTGNVGKDLVNIPRDYASLWVKYTFRDGPVAGLGLGGGARYIGASFMRPVQHRRNPGLHAVRRDGVATTSPICDPEIDAASRRR